MPVTKEQAINASEFHLGTCSITVGPRGGVKTNIVRYRRTGSTTTWKREPFRFRVPIKFGARNSGNWYLTEGNASEFHLPADCPVINPRCSYCGNTGDTVRERPDHYNRDINDQAGANHVACDPCDQRRNEDI